jgi:TrmH family RNA methyltransferase
MEKPQEIITSKQNPLVMLTASLADRKHRKKEGLFRFDGKKLLLEALDAGLPLHAVLLRESAADTVLSATKGRDLPADCRAVLLSDSVFDRLSEENAPEGVICVCRQPATLHPHIGAGEEHRLPQTGRTLVLESVRDPGNLGTIIRSAAAFGIANLVLSADCADIYHPRTIRAAMGALFSKKILITQDLTDALHVLAARGRVFAAALDDTAVRLGKVDFGENEAVVVGNEGHGLSAAALAAATDRLFIPMQAGVESLNAGVAASVLLWELYQGR